MVPVCLIVSPVAEGETMENTINDYPSINSEDVQAALHYAAKLCEYEAYFI